MADDPQAVIAEARVIRDALVGPDMGFSSESEYREYCDRALIALASLTQRLQDAEKALRQIAAMHPVDSGLRAADVARAALAAAGTGEA